MSVAYYIVLKDEMDGFDPFVNGKALAHANEKALEKLCAELKIKPLTAFISQDPEELADFIAGEGMDAPDDLPAEEWFDAEEGLLVVRTLRRHLGDNPKALKDAAAICDDLAEYEAVLERLHKEGVKWHLAVDF
jgi:hypothetical protein